MGIDLCRTILIYDNVYVPPELQHLYGKDKNMSKMLADELTNNKKLLQAGDGDSSGGSDSEPSDDNLPVEEVAKVVPIVDKNQMKKLEKIMKKKAQDEKDREDAKNKPPPKKIPEESKSLSSPMPRELL